MIGDRQRHRHLAIGLFAELPAILMMHAHRVPALLGEGRVIDDPDLDRAVPLDLRRCHLAHLGQHPLVRPGRVGNEMQQPLMLRRNLGRRRHRRHRFHALAAFRSYKANAIIVHRRRSIRVPDHARQYPDVLLEPRCTILRNLRSLATHINPHMPR